MSAQMDQDWADEAYPALIQQPDYHLWIHHDYW
jgi:hypothetical protein